MDLDEEKRSWWQATLGGGRATNDKGKDAMTRDHSSLLLTCMSKSSPSTRLLIPRLHSTSLEEFHVQKTSVINSNPPVGELTCSDLQ